MWGKGLNSSLFTYEYPFVQMTTPFPLDCLDKNHLMKKCKHFKINSTKDKEMQREKVCKHFFWLFNCVSLIYMCTLMSVSYNLHSAYVFRSTLYLLPLKYNSFLLMILQSFYSFSFFLFIWWGLNQSLMHATHTWMLLSVTKLQPNPQSWNLDRKTSLNQRCIM